MIRLNKILNEVFDKTYPFKKVGSYPFEVNYRFTSENGQIYDVDFANINDHKLWEVEFYIKGKDDNILDPRNPLLYSQDITGTGNEFKIFSTVIQIAKDFFKDYNEKVNAISFTAKESSRRKLYRHMVKKLSSENNLDYKIISPVGSEERYVVFRKGKWKSIKSDYDKAV